MHKATDAQATENATKRYKRSDNVIPDFEHLFDDDVPSLHKKRKKKSTGILYYKRLLSKNAGGVFLSLFMFILKNLPVWIIPIITSQIIDLASGGFGENTVRSLIIYSVILVVVLVQNIPTHVIYSRISDRMLRRTGAGMRGTVIRKLQHLSITYHKEIETGKLQSKFLKDIESVDALNTNLLKVLLPNIIVACVSIGISIYNSRLVTLFFLVIIPANVLLTQLFSRKMRKHNHLYRIENEAVSARFTNMLGMLPVTKAHGLENEEIAACDTNIRELTRTALAVDRTNSYFGSALWVVTNLLNCACLIFCAVFALKGLISPGDIVLYQSMFTSINGAVQTIVNVLPTFSTGFEAISSLSEIMLSKDVEDSVGKKKLTSVEGNVRFDHVCYAYPNGTSNVVDDVTLDVKKGECIAVVGASGSGKSTLMNLIIGFLRPTKGTLTIDGDDITQLSLPDYRHFISVVPQNSILFSGTIRENIVYGMDKVDEATVERAAEMANLNEFVKDLPQGLDTFVGEQGGKLSGGQKQRVTIARALIRDPRILILDEATSALDNISEYQVQKAISKLIKGRTTFIVAHRLSTIRDADRIVVMEAGKCVEIGTYDALMAKKGKFYALKCLNDMNYKIAEQSLDGDTDAPAPADVNDSSAPSDDSAPPAPADGNANAAPAEKSAPSAPSADSAPSAEKAEAPHIGSETTSEEETPDPDGTSEEKKPA